MDNEVAKLKAKGITPVDFGVGDPQDPTPEFIREACKRAVDERRSAGYPSYIGEKGFREKIAGWTRKRFGVTLNPKTEITSSIGSKEAIFNFPKAFINPGDYVLVPNPAYPPYIRGTAFAGGKIHYMNLTESNNFLPSLDAIPEDVAKKAKIMWLNYPNNPTTALATQEFYKKAIRFCRENSIILASDEPYTENYYDKKPISVLELEKEGVVVFQSLSKRSNMTCYRAGWVAGDKDIISVFKKVKTNIDSGTPTFIQDAAAAALSDESHVEQLRESYRQKRDILTAAFRSIGLSDCTPEGTIYIWQKVPEGMSSVEFAKALLKEDVAVVCTPGPWISEEAHGINPGEGYVRFALVPVLEEVRQAAERIKRMKI